MINGRSSNRDLMDYTKTKYVSEELKDEVEALTSLN